MIVFSEIERCQHPYFTQNFQKAKNRPDTPADGPLSWSSTDFSKRGSMSTLEMREILGAMSDLRADRSYKPGYGGV